MLEIDIVPAQIDDLAATAPGQQQQFDGSGGEGIAGCLHLRIERDGSIRIVDGKGASRAVKVADVEVRHTGPRGAAGWEPLAEPAARTEQLNLLD